MREHRGVPGQMGHSEDEGTQSRSGADKLTGRGGDMGLGTQPHTELVEGKPEAKLQSRTKLAARPG